MTIEEMKVVLAASYYSDFTEAAKQLDCSRAVLMRNVRNVEEKLGGTLFEKRNSRVMHSLTPLGRQVIPCLQEIVHTHSEMMENIKKLQERVENRICVGISPMSRENADAVCLLTELIRMHPQIEITSLIRQAYVLEQMLLSRQVDCAFFTYMDNETTGFDVERIIRNENIESVTVSHYQNMYIAMSDKHPLATRESVAMEELKGETLFFNRELCNEVYGKHRVREFFENAGVDERDYHIRYLDFINAKFLFYLVGKGEGMLPRIHLQHVEGVSFVPMEGFRTSYTTIMAAHRMVVNPNKRLFLESAKKLANEPLL